MEADISLDGLAPQQRLWLLSLAGFWALVLFGGFILGRPDARRTRRMPVWTRMASSIALMVAGWSWYLYSLGSEVANFALPVAIGMTLGFVGDLFMAGLLPVANPVFGGIGSFGLGHIAYISAIVFFAHRHGLAAPLPMWGAWLAWVLAGLAGWYFVVYRGGSHTALHWAALPYSLLLASTAGVGTGLALQAPVFASLAFGAALFLTSDLILAARLFNGAHFNLIDDVVWLTYGPSQMLIVYSIGAALR